MIIEGDTSVIDAIKEKKRLIKKGADHGHIRPLLIIGGGMMRGVYGGGAVTALYEEGFEDVFDWIIGISSGAPTGAYFLGGNPREGTSLFIEECCTPNFIRPLWFKNYMTRPIEMLKDPIDIGYLDQAFRGATGKPINYEGVFAHRTKLYVAVTVSKIGVSWYVNTCEREELYNAIAGSCAMPGLSTDTFVVNELQVSDGIVGRPFPLDFIKTLEPLPTHILVVSNSEQKQRMGILQKLIESLIFKVVFKSRMSPETLTKILNRTDSYWNLLNEFRESYQGIGAIVWTDGKVKAFELNSEKIKEAALASEEWWRELLR